MMVNHGKLLNVVMVGLVLFIAAACPVSAQTVSEPDKEGEPAVVSAQGEAVKNNSQIAWQSVWHSGGWPVQALMLVLIAMSFLAFTLVVYFFIVLRVKEVVPGKTLNELLNDLRKGNIEDARMICEYRPSPLTAVALAGIDYVKGFGSSEPAMIRDVMQAEGVRQSEAIQGQTQYLMDIAVISPMIGLLGTVFGMLTAFSAVALDIAQAKPVVLANGVGQALVTTASGLIVGIPAMMFYAYFRRKASKLVSILETAASQIMMAMANEGVGKDEFQA